MDGLSSAYGKPLMDVAFFVSFRQVLFSTCNSKICFIHTHTQKRTKKKNDIISYCIFLYIIICLYVFPLGEAGLNLFV